MRAISVICAGALALAACDPAHDPADDSARQDDRDAAADHRVSEDALVPYDVRLLRPSDEPLAAVVDRVRERARNDGKRVVMLFSAQWCHRCQRLEAELGSTAPASQIGDVQILMLKEEDWEAATRLDEFKGQRVRWEPAVGTFPLMLLLGDGGERLEEMKEAKQRLEAAGLEPTLANWFDTSRVSPIG